MTFTMPRVLKLAAAAVLFALATAPIQAQDWAKARLEASPRHHEYVPLKHGDRTVQAFVVYPEVKTKAPVIVLIHEIFGLSDWAKEMADELAAQGFIVVAPDLLTGFGPNGGGSSEFPSQDATVKAVSGLNPDGVTADLDAAADYGKHLPAANGKIAVHRLLLGRRQILRLRHSSQRPFRRLRVLRFRPADVTTITAPVYGFYAGNDARIGATIPATVAAMKAAGKTYEPVTYEGAGHGFMRAGEDPANTVPANKTAREQGIRPPGQATPRDVKRKEGNNMPRVVSVEARTVHIPLQQATAFARRKVTSRDYSLVKIRTDDGIEGIGHCYAGHSGGNVVTTAVREMLAPMLIGADPYSTELLWKNMYQEVLLHGRVGSVMRALSILDTALWDRNARAANLPLHKYLGAAYEDTVPAYASGGYYLEGKTPEMLGEEMAGYVALGLDAVKMKVGRGDLRSEEARIAAARKAIGPDVLLMLDANNAWSDVPTALRYHGAFRALRSVLD